MREREYNHSVKRRKERVRDNEDGREMEREILGGKRRRVKE